MLIIHKYQKYICVKTKYPATHLLLKHCNCIVNISKISLAPKLYIMKAVS